jgi:predicted MFS family arabinose efflux permease
VLFDWAGQATAVIAMAALTFGVIEAGARGIGAPLVVAAAMVALAALVGFVVSQVRGAHPMLPAQLFKARDAVIAVLVGFAFMVGYFGMPFVMSLYLQQHRSLSALATGLAFLPMMITGLVLTPFSARLAQWAGARTLIVAGLGAMAAGLVTLALLPPSTPVATLALVMMLVGLAGPLVAPPIAAVLLDRVPAPLAGTASGLYNTSRQLGGALAVATFGALLARSDSFMHGLTLSLLIAAVVSIATAAGALALHGRKTDEGASDRASDEAANISRRGPREDAKRAFETGCSWPSRAAHGRQVRRGLTD